MVDELVDKLELDETFENWVVSYACNSPRFYRMVGYAVQPESLTNDSGCWLLKAAHAIHGETGSPPESSVIVMQRLRAWSNEGKLRLAFVESCLDYLELSEDDANRMVEDAVVKELSPVLRRKAHYAAVKQALDDYQNRRDLSDVVEKIEQANKIGVSENVPGVKFNIATVNTVLKAKMIGRLGTGTDDLDFALDGGLPRGALGCAVGGAGDGKSMFLYQIAAVGLAQGCHVAVATLENPESVVISRLTACMTNIPIAQVLSGVPQVVDRLRLLEPQMGIATIREFTAKATTSKDILRWCDELGSKEGRPVDLLVVDYADKLNAPKEKDEYNAMRVVYEDLRVGVHERKIWCWTASQSTRKKKGENKTDLDSVADSINKARIVDLMVGLNVKDPQEGLTGREVELFVSKFRLGASRMTIGPVPTEFEFGRLTGSNILAKLQKVFTQ